MSGSPEDRARELRELFFDSGEELVQKMNDEALRLEKSPGNAETARSLRRIVHTLKGDAAACGFRELSELAHEFEDVLALENPAAAVAVPEIAFRAADGFAALLQAYRTGEKLPTIQTLRDDIAQLAQTESKEPGSGSARKDKNARPSTPWSEYERLAIVRAMKSGKCVHRVVVELDPRCSMPIAARQMIRLALGAMGELLAFYPDEGGAAANRFEAALASEKSAIQIRAKCNIPTVATGAKVTRLRLKIAAKPCPPLNPPAGVQTEVETPLPSDESKTAATAVPEPGASTGPAPTAAISTPENILRVDAGRIDSVLNLVGELILAKSMLQQMLAEFGERFPKDGLRPRFSDVMAFQARVLTDLQRSVMKIRMVPVDQLFRRFPRTVHDVARQCGKEVELAVSGSDTDLDKGILDAIAEPLTHLLRNAVGHGIETAAERTRAGKRPQGTVRLSAYHQGNQVVIEVSDDGRGIDLEKVRQRALVQHIVKPEDAAHMTESETLDLILQPGFSTAEEVTELSGRGIGLDVVESVLARLKGAVQIETTPGHGTTFRLRLPLTLAIIRALLFRVEQRLYAIPLNAVAEIARTTEEHIQVVEHYEVLQLRNDAVPLLRLGAAPEPGPQSAARKAFVLVINHGDRKFGLIVDALAGEGELVLKALDDHSITTDLVSGASILGDGRVVLILNLTALVERFTRRRAGESSPMTGLLSNLNPMSANPGRSGADRLVTPPNHGSSLAHGMAGGQA